MRIILSIGLIMLCGGLQAQRILPNQIRPATGSDKQTALISDGTTGVFDYESEMIFPYDSGSAADGQYDIGSIVIYGGYIYRSSATNNVTTPGVSATWEIVPTSEMAGETRLTQDSILVYYREGAEVGRDTISGVGGGGGSESIGPTTVIRRVLEPGDTVTASTPGEFLAWFEFVEPSMSLTLSPSTTTYEVGTSNSIDLRVVTTNDAGATLSNGTLTRTNPASNTVSTFGAVAGDTVSISFTPTQAGSGDYNQLTYSFQATQDYTGAESGSVSSNTRTIRGVYPVFYGMASTDTATVFSDIYGTLTKSVVTENDRSYAFTGSGLIYYCFPNTWSDRTLSSIIDPNGFDVTASFDRVAGHVLTSDDLTNDYTNVSCTCYVLNTGTTTTSSSTYTFNQ